MNKHVAGTVCVIAIVIGGDSKSFFSFFFLFFLEKNEIQGKPVCGKVFTVIKKGKFNASFSLKNAEQEGLQVDALSCKFTQQADFYRSTEEQGAEPLFTRSFVKEWLVAIAELIALDKIKLF